MAYGYGSSCRHSQYTAYGRGCLVVIAVTGLIVGLLASVVGCMA